MVRGAIERMRRHFDAQEQLREQLLEASRRAIRSSARAIAAMHREDTSAAEENLTSAKREIATLAEAIRAEPQLADSGMVLSAFQEYSEALLMRALISEGELPSPEEISTPYKPYLMALADVTGELRRRALDLIRGDEVANAELMLKRMEDILDILMSFDYSDAVLPGMKRRQDIVRGLIEKTRGDLTTAIRQQKLEKALERAERSRVG